MVIKMNDFIKWCNLNQGFIEFVLSCLTLLVSIIAIVISISTARLPYKKKLMLTFGTYIGVGIEAYGIYVAVTNIGNRNVRIQSLGLLVGKKQFFNVRTIEESRVSLATGDGTEQSFEQSGLKVNLAKYSSSMRVYAFAVDSEGKIYKKYICKVSEISAN